MGTIPLMRVRFPRGKFIATATMETTTRLSQAQVQARQILSPRRTQGPPLLFLLMRYKWALVKEVNCELSFTVLNNFWRLYWFLVTCEIFVLSFFFFLGCKLV